MNASTRKLRIIYLPFLIIAVSVILIYTFLNWLLFIKYNVFPLKEQVVNFWIPFIISWIPILIWLRPRINLLKFKNDNISFLYYTVAALAITAPTIVAQEYLKTASGSLTRVENISQLAQKEATKYYSVSNYYIDKANVGVHSTANVSGKNNEYLNYTIYVAIPVRANAADSSSGESLYFLGERYTKRISNRLSEKEKDKEYAQFANQTQEKFDTSVFSNIVYMETMANSEDRDGMKEAVAKGKAISPGTPIVFNAHYDSFEARNGSKLGWIFLSFGIGALVWLTFLLAAAFKEIAPEKSEESSKKESSYHEALALFIPREGYYITPIILNLNLIVYLIMVFAGLGFISFKAIDLLHWGGNFRPATTNGEWWRLLTSVFLHGGLMHLVANMIGLVFAGIFLEPVVGKKKFAIIYLVTGILASVTSLWWHEKTVSIGASGAIFGLYGLMLALLLMKVFSPAVAKAFLFSTLFFVGYNLLMGLKGGIDNAAHIGGLLSGFIIGVILAPSLKTAMAERAAEAEVLQEESAEVV